MKALLCCGSCLLLACGGKGSVDLGDSWGWADTRDTDAASRSVPAADRITVHEAQTLYQGRDSVEAIAVDETTIAALIVDWASDTSRIDLCRFEDCQGTLQTIEAIPAWQDPVFLRNLTISHEEVFWIRGWSQPTSNLVDADGNPVEVNSTSSEPKIPGVFACPTSGCPNGPRHVVRDDQAVEGTLAADAESLFWFTFRDGLQVARCARSGCEVPDLVAVHDDVELHDLGLNAREMVIDEAHQTLYLTGTNVIARMPTDFSAPPTMFYATSSTLGGTAVVEDYVYFAQSSLIGEIRRCPVTGCGAEPELVVSAPRWPSRLVADARAAYWVHNAETSAISRSSGSVSGDTGLPTISAATLNPAGEPRALVDGLRSGGPFSFWPSPDPVVINSHHLYWCEVTDTLSYVPNAYSLGSSSSGFAQNLRIRTMKR